MPQMLLDVRPVCIDSVKAMPATHLQACLGSVAGQPDTVCTACLSLWQYELRMGIAVLRNGVDVPLLGLGTHEKQCQHCVAPAVAFALQHGIRHVDTAHVYRNEHLVAEGIQKSGVPRSDVFVVSKLGPSQQGAEAARQGALDMVSKLGQPVDLALIHWPGASGMDPSSRDNIRLRTETWRVMEEMYEQGMFRAIGVSNFEVPHLKQLAEVAKVQPMVNQIEVHPYWPNTELVQFCQSQGIVVTAYSPLGRGQLVGHEVVQRVAEAEGKTPAQVLIRWGQQKGCVSIPKSVKPDRITEFLDLIDPKWALSAEAVAALDGLAPYGGKLCRTAHDVV